MILTDELPPLSWFGGNHFAIVFPPLPLDLNEIVGVYPRFEGVLVLGWKCHEGSNENLFGEYDDVFVVAFSLIIVCSSRQGIGAPVRFPRYVFQFNRELFEHLY